MLDRDEVIKDAEHAIAMLGNLEEPTHECDFIRVSFENTLALLMEQEPVEPIRNRETGTQRCGICGTFICSPPNRFCPNCGRKVKRKVKR